MKNYSEVKDISPYSQVRIELEPVGTPNIRISTPTGIKDYPGLSEIMIIDYDINILEPHDIVIELYNKHYTTEYETAIIFKIYIDNINIIPEYSYLAEYINDHNNNNPTNYLGFNGKWTLTIDRPFYHWLHEHSGQGWLIG
jgi:hypothetical protein